MVTSYDAWSARLLADSPVDCLLVGDSAMMVVHGEKDTLGATPEIMALHTRAVAEGRPGEIHRGRHALPRREEGGGPRARVRRAAPALRRPRGQDRGRHGHLHVIRHLVESGIPVMGHLGLTPQWVRGLGGFKVQARDAEAAGKLQEDALALEGAGAFALVLECIPQALARRGDRLAADPDDRHRRRGRHATARSSSCTTCWASTPTSGRGSPAASRTGPRLCAAGPSASRRPSAPGNSPRKGGGLLAMARVFTNDRGMAGRASRAGRDRPAGGLRPDHGRPACRPPRRSSSGPARRTTAWS